ncbi:MAG: PIG-L family deacetylase, partial [Anaerolineae bacterium]|nr:PIG-L family deacetylase [Anaerolineae bacterium]
HTDDVELGAGGTVARLVEEGARVWIAAFSLGNAEGEEAIAAAERLGVTLLGTGKFPTRRFAEYRQDVLDYLVSDWMK